MRRTFSSLPDDPSLVIEAIYDASNDLVESITHDAIKPGPGIMPSPVVSASRRVALIAYVAACGAVLSLIAHAYHC